MRYAPDFIDRAAAGKQLAPHVLALDLVDPIVLALPRGGVPVAFPVAKALRAPLDVVLVRKIGAPGHPELGLGAVVDGADPQVILNEEIVAQLDVAPAYIAEQVRRELKEIERRRSRYRGGRASLAITGRNVIVVDDGIATGGTVKAALKGIALAGPSRLVLAVPVAPVSALAELKGMTDEIICLVTPEHFQAVGMHYRDFTQTSDELVISLLDGARSL
jgi:putative phosphoribosyl transferase